MSFNARNRDTKSYNNEKIEIQVEWIVLVVLTREGVLSGNMVVVTANELQPIRIPG